MCMFYFYILISEKDRRLYYGYTSDLKKRMEQHERGTVTSTKHRRPLRLVYYEAYCDKLSAQARETSVKRSGRIRKRLQERLQLVN
jgi:putative endonuclease